MKKKSFSLVGHLQVLCLECGVGQGVWLCWGRYLQSQPGRDGEVVAIFCEVYRNRVGFQAPASPNIL